jgi:hypothetical protein
VADEDGSLEVKCIENGDDVVDVVVELLGRLG